MGMSAPTVIITNLTPEQLVLHLRFGGPLTINARGRILVDRDLMFQNLGALQSYRNKGQITFYEQVPVQLNDILVGATGVQGITGLSLGSTGLAGADGQTGPAGMQGTTGAGTQGATGVSIQGQTGFQGATGIGIQGVTGIAGANGAGGIPQFTYNLDASISISDVGKMLYREGSVAKVANNVNVQPPAPATIATALMRVNSLQTTALNASQGHATVIFGAQPANGDTITFYASYPANNGFALAFSSTTSDSHTVQIGATLADTIASAVTLMSAYSNSTLHGLLFSGTSTTFRVTLDPAVHPGSKDGPGFQASRVLTNGPGRFHVDTTEGNFLSTSGDTHIINGTDGFPGVRNSVTLKFDSNPIEGEGLQLPDGAFIFSNTLNTGTNSFNYPFVLIGATVADTVANLLGHFSTDLSQPPRSSISTTSDSITWTELLEHNTSSNVSVNQVAPQIRIILSLNIIGQPTFASNSGDGSGMEILNATPDGHASGFVEGIANVTASQVGFQDNADGFSTYLTAGVDYTIGSSVTDQRDKIFDSLVANFPPFLIFTKVGSDEIQCDRNTTGDTGGFNWTRNGGFNNEFDQLSQSNGSDAFAGNPGYAPLGLGKLLVFNGATGILEEVTNNTFVAFENIPAGSPLAAGPDGKIKIGNPAIDYITGVASTDYNTGEMVKVDYAPVLPNNWQQPPPASFEEAFKRMEVFVVQNFGAP